MTEEFKRFAYLEDNGDNTTTVLIRIEEGRELKAVVDLSFDIIVSGMSGLVDHTTPEAQEMMDKIILIPDSADCL